MKRIATLAVALAAMFAVPVMAQPPTSSGLSPVAAMADHDQNLSIAIAPVLITVAILTSARPADQSGDASDEASLQRVNMITGDFAGRDYRRHEDPGRSDA